MQRFSIIIATLNEVANIGPLLNRIHLMAQQHGMDPEIIFVDDGSARLTLQNRTVWMKIQTVLYVFSSL
jgi:glycosyltransferase involved in cell wall biosynthesis